MKKSLLKILLFSIISSHIFISESLKALIPYYYFPETKSYQKKGLSIGKQAYQLLYFGQIKDSLNLAKLAIKQEADYVAFGAFNFSKTKKVKYKANIKILNWSKKTTNIPIVAIGGINFENYKKLLLNKANFLAISSYIWNNKKYKPLETIKKLK